MLFAVLFTLERQEAGCKTEGQQPIAYHQAANCELNPGGRVRIKAHLRGVRVISGSCDQTDKVVIPAGENGCQYRENSGCHQVAEVLHFFRINQYDTTNNWQKGLTQPECL